MHSLKLDRVSDLGRCQRLLMMKKLARYYKYLLKSESRHYEDYLMLARSITDDSIDERVAFFF